MASGAYEFHYGSWTDTTGANKFVRAYIYHKEIWANDKLNMHWWAGIDVKANYRTDAKFTMTTSATNASNRSATVDNMGYTGGAHAIIKDVDYNWPKKTTAYTVTVTATLKPYGKSASTVSISYTVPALTKYTISFNSNGGTSCASQTNYYSYTITLPTPSRTGYKFKGWATTNGGAVSYNGGASYTVTANATLYAVWEVTYITPIIQGSVIGYRVGTTSLPVPPNKPEEDSEGTMAYIQFTTNSGTNVDYNQTHTSTYSINNGTATSFTLNKINNNDDTYTYYGIINPTNPFDIGTSYNIKISLTNKSTAATGSANLVTTTAFVLSKQVYAIDISADSRRIAFGGSATDSSSGTSRSDFGIEIYGNDVSLTHSLADTETYFRAKRLDTDTGVSFGIDTGGINHGIWSEPLNKWMIYSDGDHNYIYDSGGAAYRRMSKEYATPSITRSAGGTISGQLAFTWGGFTQLYLYLTYTTSVAAGGNVFTGTLNNYKPGCLVTGVGYYGAHAIVCRINTAGNIVIKNSSSSAVTLSDGVAISLTYIST